MNSREIYKRFLLKLNRNDTNEGVNILPAHFVLIFNNESIRWLGEKLKEEADNIRLDRLDSLFVSDLLIKQTEKSKDGSWQQFEFPDNFYRHSSSYGLVDKHCCENIKVYYFEKKSLGSLVFQADEFSRSNVEMEEGRFIIIDKQIKAYTDDFTIKKFYTSFYKTPDPIDIAGYERIDGSQSTDIDSTLADDNIDEILDRVVIEVTREFKDSEGFEFANQRKATEP